MGDRAAKDALYEGLATAARAVANGRRAELVDVLAQGERSVEALATEIGQSVANTSQHLRILAGSGLVASRRDGTRVIYRLAGAEVEALWAALRAVATAHVAGIERLSTAYLGDRDGLEQVTRQELARRLRADGVVAWDVRPLAEYTAGHIKGAVSVPPGEVRRRLRGVPIDVDVVAYCRGPFCVYADDAVRALTRKGRRAVRLEDGFPEWRQAGLPVVAGVETGS